MSLPEFFRSNHQLARAGLLFFLALAAFIFVPQIELWPQLSQDEVQIVDQGRASIEPGTDWGTSWLVHESRPSSVKFDPVKALQEYAYRAFEPRPVGPRLSALLGAFVATFLLFGWLRAMRLPPWVALGLSLAFFLDPIFNESYRQGRVDSWALAVCMGALLMLRLAGQRIENRGSGRREILAAGALTAAAPLAWLTTLAVIPLVLAEFLKLLRKAASIDPRGGNHRPMRLVYGFAAGGALVLLLSLVPSLFGLEFFLTGMTAGIGVQTAAAGIQRPIIDIYMLYSPMIVVAVAAALLVRRDLWQLSAMAIAIWMMYQTMIYPMRVLYLLPYLVALLAGAHWALRANPRIKRRRAVLIAALAALVAFNAWISLAKRPFMALQQAEARSPEQIYDSLSDRIGEGSYRVLTTEWEVYYAARRLGWKLYTPYGHLRKGTDEFRAFLDSMDYAITREKFDFAKAVRAGELENAGFERVAVLEFRQPESSSIRMGPVSVQVDGRVFEDLIVYRNPRSDSSGNME